MNYLSQNAEILRRLGGDWVSFHWYRDPKSVLPSALHFQQHGRVKIQDCMVLSEWMEFLAAVGGRGGVVLSSVSLPRHWPCPANIHMVQDHSHIFRVIDSCLARAKGGLVFHRQVRDGQPRFVSMGGEFDRVIFMQWLRALGLDHEAELFHPASDPLQFDPDRVGINPDLRACTERVLMPYHRFDAARNFDVLKPCLQGADFELVLPNRCLQDSANFITEKDTWHILFGVPAVVLESETRRQWFQDLGFVRYTPVFPGTGQVLYHSVIQWLCYYHRFNLAQRQRWQDQQGEIVCRNWDRLPNIMDLLLERCRREVESTL